MPHPTSRLALLGGLLAALVAAAQPVITQPPTNVTVALGGAATFTVAATGTGPFTYQWFANGKALAKEGVITTVVGGGTSLADGIPATEAALSPQYLMVDSAGTLFVADTGNNLIRKITTNGIISTVAGNGHVGLPGTVARPRRPA